MSNEYISRESVLADIEQTIENSGCVNHEREIIDCVRYASAADVAPAVHAKIVTAGEGPTHWAACSACGGAVDPFDRYCRHCPAKFDENPDGGEPHAY